MGDLWRDAKEASRKKKFDNVKFAESQLLEAGISFTRFSETHWRVGDFDYWPSTGKFIHIRTKVAGRGIFNLMNRLGAR